MNSTIKTLVGDTLQSSDTNLNKTQKKTLRHIVLYMSLKKTQYFWSLNSCCTNHSLYLFIFLFHVNFCVTVSISVCRGKEICGQFKDTLLDVLQSSVPL